MDSLITTEQENDMDELERYLISRWRGLSDVTKQTIALLATGHPEVIVVLESVWTGQYFEARCDALMN